jgi:AcrR family transcriptional regulator
MPARTPLRRRPPAPRSAAHLADRLVDTTEAILAEAGLEGLSMREVARRAGVTHGAPLRHYASFAALLAEVAARGFRSLDEAVESAANDVAPGAGPTARLAAGARASLDCAIARPALFALMFRPELVDASHGSFAADSNAAFEQLVRLVRGAQDGGWRTTQDTRQLAGSLWASIHGLASLWSHGAYAIAVRNQSFDAALESLLELTIGETAPTARRRR